MAFLDYAGLAHYRQKTLEYLMTKISRTELAFVDKRFRWINDLMNGQKFDLDKDTTEAYSKAVPAGAKVVSVNSIGGKTIVMNQQYPDDVTESFINHGITFDRVGSKITATGYADDGNAYSKPAWDADYPTGHKYLIRGCPPGGSASTYNLFIHYTAAQSSFAKDIGSGKIVTPGTSSSYFEVRIQVNKGTTMNGKIFVPEVIDLTKWFNGDSAILASITTPEDAYALGVPRTYIPYNEGEIISADCDLVVSTGKNRFGGIAFRQALSTAGVPNALTANPVPCRSALVDGDTLYSGYFKPNTQYTFILKAHYVGSATGSHASSCFRWMYSDGTFETMKYYSRETPVTPDANVSAEGKTVIGIDGGGTSLGINHEVYPDECCLLEGVHTVDDFVAYVGALGALNIPERLCEDYPLRSAPSVHDEYDFANMKHIARVGSRAHAEGDEDDSTVITDGTTTYYALATPVETDISSYFDTDFDALIPCETGGNITFEQAETEFKIPNELEYAIKLSAAGG